MLKRFAPPLAVLSLLSFAVGAHAGKADLDKLGEKCRAGGAKQCDELAKIATSDPDPATRQAAVHGVTDQVALAIISARNEETEAVRLAAIERLTDQATLANIVNSPAPGAIREHALGRLQDQKRLGAIAKECKDWGLRRAAVAKLTDSAVLEDVAANASDSYTVVAAVARIEDPAALVRLARSEDVGAAMARAIAERIADPAVITDLALTTRGSMRDEARARCTDNATLGQLVKKDLAYKAPTTGRDIVKITDPSVLADLAQSARAWETRRDAVQRLRDPAVLGRIAKGDENADVRALAVRRAAAVRRGLVATGRLVEASVGRPLAHFTVEIGAYGTVPVAVAVTDGDGRFSLDGLEPGKWDLMHSGSVLRGAKDEVSVKVPAAGRVDLGTVAVQHDELVTHEYAALCDAPGTPGNVPEGALVVFTKEPRGWTHRYGKLNQFGWTPPWNAALCIDEGGELVGGYVEKKSGKFVGNAYATTWKVRVIRLSDGKTFADSFTADPPKTTTGYRSGLTGEVFATGSGDPSAAFLAWLKEIR